MAADSHQALSSYALWTPLPSRQFSKKKDGVRLKVGGTCVTAVSTGLSAMPALPSEIPEEHDLDEESGSTRGGLLSSTLIRMLVL